MLPEILLIIVLCNNYRNPALLAKMTSCLDVLSRGRFELGIGAGWYEPDYTSYGYRIYLKFNSGTTTGETFILPNCN